MTVEQFPQQTIDTLVDEIYLAAVDTSRWQSVVDRIGALCEGGVVSLQGHDFSTNRHLGVLTAGFSPEAVASFRDHYAGVNPWAPGMARWPVGRTLVAENIVAREDLLKTEFYNDFLRREGDIGLGVGVIAHRSNLRYFALSVNMRLKDEERLEPQVIALFDTLGPHLQRAFRVSRAIANVDPTRSRLDAFEAMATPVFVLSASGKTLYANGAARDVTGDVAHYVDRRDNELRFLDKAANTELADAINRVTRRVATSAAASFHVRSNDGSDLATATVVPLMMLERDRMFLDFAPHGTARVLLCLETAATLRGNRRQRLLAAGLSDAETDVVLGLCEGKSAHDLAGIRGKSVNTIRNQMQSAYSKLGVRRQSELLVRILQLPSGT